MNDDLEYSPRVLDDTPSRVTDLIHGITSSAAIRTKLHDAGMTDDDVDEGCALLVSALTTRRVPAFELDTVDAKRHRAAVAELDSWDEPAFARFGATLKRHFPSAFAYVFEDLKASRGAESVNGVAIFLARIDALEAGSDPARSSFKDDDAKAVALLEKRGLTKEERARLQKLVRTALSSTSPLPPMPSADVETERQKRLEDLRRWYEEWSSTAKAVIKRRGDLIRLGLATRRAHEEEVVVPTPEPVTNGKGTATTAAVAS